MLINVCRSAAFNFKVTFQISESALFRIVYSARLMTSVGKSSAQATTIHVSVGCGWTPFLSTDTFHQNHCLWPPRACLSACSRFDLKSTILETHHCGLVINYTELQQDQASAEKCACPGTRPRPHWQCWNRIRREIDRAQLCHTVCMACRLNVYSALASFAVSQLSQIASTRWNI